MKRADYIRMLSNEELALYLYFNKKKTGLGIKRITEWVNEEINPEEEERK